MVTIKDIAKACGVSPATVSKALNNAPDVSRETAERIRQMAKEMHYLPNSAARTLKNNVSNNIGVVFQDDAMSGLTHEFFNRILNASKNELEGLGYDITFISAMIGGNSFVEHCRYRKCDGVLIVCGDFNSPKIRELVDSEFPFVSIDYSFEGHSSVFSDNDTGTYEIVKYLYMLGHRKIAFIHGEDCLVTRKRLQAFDRACREFGLEIPESYLLDGVFHDPDTAEKRTEELMSLPERPTAILYPDDYAYIGGRTALEKMNLSVPGDVSVVGYDGNRLSQVLRPPLTTWYQDAVMMGKLAADKLVETIEAKGKCKPEQLLVHGLLLPGGTVRRLKAGEN